MKLSVVILVTLSAFGTSAAPSKQAAGAPFSGSTVATWWGGGDGRGGHHELSEVCSQPVDLVGISFYNGTNPPSLTLGAYSWKASDAQIKAGYGGLKDLTAPVSKVASQVQGCQKAGKKMVLTLGGDRRWAHTTFSSAKNAQDSATMIWNLFLGGTDRPQLRPFGRDVVLDGLDIDNEMDNSNHYSEFVSTLRGLMDGDSKKKYLIGATPWVGSLGSDTSKISVPTGIFGMLDYIAVQFYNADVGSIGTKTFEKALGDWTSAINKANARTKILLGVMVPGAGNAGPWAQSADAIKKSIEKVKAKKIKGFGGVAVWEAGAAINYDKKYISSVAAAVGRSH